MKPQNTYFFFYLDLQISSFILHEYVPKFFNFNILTRYSKLIENLFGQSIKDQSEKFYWMTW